MAKRQITVSLDVISLLILLFLWTKNVYIFSRAGRDEVPEKADDSTPPITTLITTPIAALFWFSFFPWKKDRGPKSISLAEDATRTRREWKRKWKDGEKAGIYATWMSSVFWFHSSPEKVQRVEDPFPHALQGVKPPPSPGLV